jgi:hypothetical protein
MCDIRSISRFVLAVRRNSSDMILYFSSAMFYMIYSRSVLKCYYSVFSCGCLRLLRGHVTSKTTCLVKRYLEGSACSLILAFAWKNCVTRDVGLVE